MKSFALFLLSLIFTSSLLAQSNQEFRAIWVVDSQWLTAGDSESENKALIREILDNHQKANMTSVLWQVRRFGTVYYKSNIEPWGPQTGFSEPGYDPLAYALEQAHARGLEFHAWMNVFESRHAYAGSPAQRHPNWIARDQAGTPMPQDLAWLSPGLADVRDYLKNIALEIVNNYDIDGLHLDFVRWSEHTSSSHSLALAKQNMERDLPDGFITAAQLEELQNNAAGRFLYDVNHPFSAGVPAGFNSWPEWWRWSVTEFVRAVHDSIQAVKPWVRLSPAALGRYNWGGWQGFDVVYQDAALWLNERYIDQLIGMHYHWSVPQDFYSVLVGGCPNCWSQFIQPAIQAGQLYSVGLFSDSFSDRNIFNRHQSIVERVRQVSWVDGLQFFSQKSWQERKYWEKAKALFFQQKTKIRAPKLIDDTAPAAPAIALNKIDSLNYQIKVTPDASIAADHWFAIYRSPNDVLRADSDEIIDIHFGSTPYSFTDAFAGTQDFNGKYHYFATAFDRFWNESTLSNSAVSDSIPSFAPQILLTSPAVGDTIPVNQPISLTFSKTMDTNSFLGAVALAPALTVNKLNWSDDQKTVTILTAGAFEYATEYTLTVAADVTDINGKALDGNGDGVSGDDFELHFHTLAQDVTGPQLIFSFPDFQSQETNFAIDEVLSFVFDELLDNSSVAKASKKLLHGQKEIPTNFKVTQVENKSVLSIQALQPLENSTEYTVTLSKTIADTAGNEMPEDLAVTFTTSPEHYSEVTVLEPFLSVNNWFQPDGSGSTMGIVVPNTSFSMSTEAYLPSASVRQRVSPMLKYEWDESQSDFLIRLFLSGGPPRNVLFDTTRVLQCHVFGDGSRNKFRFAVDDSTKDRAAFHEVSEWVTINWYGWRLLEWQLSDPNSVGVWIGDGVLNGPSLRFDSFQLTHDAGDAVSGKIFFDNLRLVKKSTTPVSVADNKSYIPKKVQLYQNYPNPFNPTTNIAFDLAENGLVVLKIFDTLGREVASLVHEQMPPGNYIIPFDASGLASGVYFYRLTVNNQRTMSKRMLLMK